MTATLSSKQVRSIIEADAEVNVWHGSVRSGKTLASLICFAEDIARDRDRPGRTVIIGRTVDTIYRNVISGLIELLGTGDGGVRYTRGANTAVILGVEVDIIGASDARSESRIRGMTIGRAYVDEATLLPDHGYWQQLLNRMLTVARRRLWATTNPDNPTHWFKVHVIDKAAELGYRVWHFALDDNPVLTDEAKAAAAAANVGLFYRRNILGEWTLADGVIWDMWDDERHVVDELPEIHEYLLSIDYGTAGVFAATLLGLGDDDRIHVCREWRYEAKGKRTLTDVEYSRRLRTWLDSLEDELPGASEVDRVHVDPSATSFITQLYTDGWAGVTKADNAVADGLRDVASLLGMERLKVHRSCAGLIGEIPGYVWDPKASAKGEDKPLKANDHSCDALRYGVRATRRWWRDWTPDEAPDEIPEAA